MSSFALPPLPIIYSPLLSPLCQLYLFIYSTSPFPSPSRLLPLSPPRPDHPFYRIHVPPLPNVTLPSPFILSSIPPFCTSYPVLCPIPPIPPPPPSPLPLVGRHICEQRKAVQFSLCGAAGVRGWWLCRKWCSWLIYINGVVTGGGGSCCTFPTSPLWPLPCLYLSVRRFHSSCPLRRHVYHLFI